MTSGRSTAPRGFTLLELMVTVAIIGILAAITTWRIQATLPRYRSKAAARRFLVEVREARAIAARTNRPILVQVDAAGDAACNPSVTVVNVPPAGQPARTYARICLNEDYPGVTLGNGGNTAAVSCALDSNAGLAALPNCSMCAGSPDTSTLTNTIRILPSGETSVAPATPAGATIAFSPAHDGNKADTVAVGIRPLTGAARIYRPAGSGWECP